jgi:hypothetical protein
VACVPDAVPEGSGTENLQPLGVAANAAHLTLGSSDAEADTQVSLFDQGPVQVPQAAVTGLKPKQPYVLAPAEDAKGTGALQPLASFTTNPAGAAIVNAVGPLRQIVTGDGGAAKRHLVIAPAEGGKSGTPVQLQQ